MVVREDDEADREIDSSLKDVRCELREDLGDDDACCKPPLL